MNYHIGRDGQQLGTFTKEQITQGLADGSVRGTDMAWAEGMEDWQPVSSLSLVSEAVPAPLGDSPPPVPVRRPGSTPAVTGQPETCGLATASLVLGILSFLLACFTSLPAIICGHLALGRITRSNGTLAGRGMAVAGLVMGYLFTALIPVIAILAALAVPAFNGVQEKAKQMQAVNNARQVIISLKSYTSDHGGKYPPTLDELVKAKLFDDKKTLDSLLEYPQFRGWSPEKGYDYAGGMDSDSGQKVILMSRSHAQNGRRILAHNDGSVDIAVPSQGSGAAPAPK